MEGEGFDGWTRRQFGFLTGGLLAAVCGSTIVASGVCCQQIGAQCAFDSDCCANTASCGIVSAIGCVSTEPVCCKGNREPCVNACDCCDPWRCTGGTCQ